MPVEEYTEDAVIDHFLVAEWTSQEMIDLIGANYYPEDVYPDSDELYLVYQMLPYSHDSKIVGARRVHTDAVYQITINKRGGTLEELRRIFAVVSRRIDRRFYVNVLGGQVQSCVRDGLTRGSIQKHGNEYRYYGGFFNIAGKVI